MKYSLEAERELIGAVLNKPDLMCDVISLDPTDFYAPAHQTSFLTIKQMFEKGEAIELTTVVNRLGKSLPEVGGITYLTQLYGGTLAKDVKAYRDIIKEKSVLRKLHSNLQKALRQLEEDKKAEEIVNFLQEKTLNTGLVQEEDGLMELAISEFIEGLENRYKNGGEIPGIKTHLEKLNFLLGGFKKKELIIIAARPSMGKSVLATNLASHIALKEKRNVAMFNLEMSKDAMVKRMVSNIARLESNKMRDGRLNDREWANVLKATAILNTTKLSLYDSTFSINEMYSTCKKLKIQNKLDIVIIDYLGLIDGAGAENRVQEISKISRRLKMMAKELDITVIALAQLSRAPEQRSDHRPILSDLRESGSIEQDADVVMFLYRDAYYNAESKEPDIVEIIVAKQRDGKLGAIKCKWMPEFQRICGLYDGGL
jgi:replicative DNA helicase